jgi:hypothetical protein
VEDARTHNAAIDPADNPHGSPTTMHIRFAAAVLVAIVASACSAPEFVIQPDYALTSPDGHIKLAGNGVNTGSNSLDSLGIKDSEGTFGLRADFDWILPHLTVTTQQTSYDGSGKLTADVSDGGVVIPAGTKVDSSLDLGITKGVITFDIMPTQAFELGIGLGLSAIDFKASVKEPGTNNKVETDETVPVPLLALRAGATIWRFAVEGLLAGVSYNSGGDNVEYMDLDLGARLNLFGESGRRSGSFAFGYRYVDLQAKYDSGGTHVDGDMNFSGPYLGFAFGF